MPSITRRAVGYEIPRDALHSLRPVLAEHGLAEEDEFAQLDQEFDEAKERTDVQWVSSPWMFEWIGRKPTRRESRAAFSKISVL